MTQLSIVSSVESVIETCSDLLYLLQTLLFSTNSGQFSKLICYLYYTVNYYVNFLMLNLKLCAYLAHL